jgi:hypothetical protein
MRDLWPHSVLLLEHGKWILAILHKPLVQTLIQTILLGYWTEYGGWQLHGISHGQKTVRA